MKATVYLKIAKGGKKGYKVEASTTPSAMPIIQKGSYSNSDTYLPTVCFGAVFDIDEKMFNQASTIVAEINVAMKDGVIANEIVVPKGITVKNKK